MIVHSNFESGLDTCIICCQQTCKALARLWPEWPEHFLWPDSNHYHVNLSPYAWLSSHSDKQFCVYMTVWRKLVHSTRLRGGLVRSQLESEVFHMPFCHQTMPSKVWTKIIHSGKSLLMGAGST